jgi:N-carbamoylputrescine amidase
MRVTICELSDDEQDLERGWTQLLDHVRTYRSEFVLLPEMPFYPWVATRPEVDDATWRAAAEAHDAWLSRFPELDGATVAGTRPVVRDGRRLNEGFVWSLETGYRAVHDKVFLPDEEGFWEASWYEPGPENFRVVDVGGICVGFLICTELWFAEYARAYGDAGIHLLLCPRATPLSSVDKWIAGGQYTAVVAGAFCLSSNRAGVDDSGMRWGGTGWLIEPAEGRVLGLTAAASPYLTLDLALGQAEAAKLSYPRYVRRPR